MADIRRYGENEEIFVRRENYAGEDRGFISYNAPRSSDKRPHESLVRSSEDGINMEIHGVEIYDDGGYKEQFRIDGNGEKTFFL